MNRSNSISELYFQNPIYDSEYKVVYTPFPYFKHKYKYICYPPPAQHVMYPRFVLESCAISETGPNYRVFKRIQYSIEYSSDSRKIQGVQ